MSSRVVGAAIGPRSWRLGDQIFEAVMAVRVVARHDHVLQVGADFAMSFSNFGYSASDTTSTRARLSASMKR